MLGSAHDGEVAAAGRRAHELLSRAGLVWNDVVAKPKPPPPAVAGQVRPQFAATVAYCWARSDDLNDWEYQFIQSISRRSRLSEAQQNKLNSIAEKLAKWAAA